MVFSALYFSWSRPESNSAVVLLSWWNIRGRLTVRRLIIFSVKRLNEDPYLKCFVSRVRSKHRERFCSFSRYTTRLRVGSFFLTALHRAVGTKAVKGLKTAANPSVYRLETAAPSYLHWEEAYLLWIMPNYNLKEMQALPPEQLDLKEIGYPCLEWFRVKETRSVCFRLYNRYN